VTTAVTCPTVRIHPAVLAQAAATAALLLPGQLSQELALPSHFEQASQLVSEDALAEVIPCGPDPERHLASIRQYLDAGFDEVYVSQIGDDQAGFFDFYRRELDPGSADRPSA
jgi:hypothetical protein